MSKLPELDKFVGTFPSNAFSRGLISTAGFILLAILKAGGRTSSSSLLDEISRLTERTWKDAETASILKRLQKYELIKHVAGSGKRGDPKHYQITENGESELVGRAKVYRNMASFIEAAVEIGWDTPTAPPREHPQSPVRESPTNTDIRVVSG